ncbi:MAG: iron ABC transporter permease [Sedimentisphaerales bacterium]|nr:iron ABC transporter permease [Sedimentisphaerales bacterium]
MYRPVTRRTLIIRLLWYLLPAGLVLLAAPCVGAHPLGFARMVRGLAQGFTGVESDIFFYQRIPRVLLGFLVGGTLALVGAVFQVVLRNPLATPYTLGVTGGGALGAVLAIMVPGCSWHAGPFSTVQLFSLAGSGAVLGLLYLLARRPRGISMNTLLLAGVTVGILCGALIMLVRYLASPHLLIAMDHWLMGGLDVVGYRGLAGLFALWLPGVGFLLLLAPAYNHLALGEQLAAGYGIDVAGVQRLSLLGGGLATAAVVSLAGPIGFVGLLVPHAVRRLSGLDHRIVLPCCFLAGGALLVACDTLARTILAPTEMPVGILTAVVGGPFFIYLLCRQS